MSVISGVYQIENIDTKDIYIGSSCDAMKRISHHRSYLRRSCHWNTLLQEDWNIFGEKNFEFSVLITCHPDMLKWYEQQFIDQWRPGYNICQFADGRYHAEETKRKMSISKLGNQFGKGLIGYKRSEENRRNMSTSKLGNQNWKGKHHSEESKIRMSERRKEWWARQKSIQLCQES